MKESEVKAQMVHSIKKDGGYARRIEDRYALGIPDCVFITKGCPAVFFAEVKVVTGFKFGPTDRQLVELTRINNADSPYAFGIMIGWKQDTVYFSEPVKVIDIRECFSVTQIHMNFSNQLSQFYYARLKK